MEKEKTGSFVLTLPMKTEKWQEDYLNKVFRMSEIFYNDLLGRMLKRYKNMIQTKEWRRIRDSLLEIYEKSKDADSASKKDFERQKKDLYKKKSDILKANGFSEYSFQKEANKLRKRHYHLIDSTLSYTIGSNLFKGFEKVLFSKGKKLHWKRKGSLETISNFWNKSGMRVMQMPDGTFVCTWGKRFTIPIRIDKRNCYEVEAFDHPIKFCRIKRVRKLNRDHFFCQILFAGDVPRKVNKKTGEFTRQPGKGKVDVDIYPDKVAIKTNDSLEVMPLAPSVQSIEDEIQKLDFKIENSRRVNNPDNFNEDGTIRKLKGKRLTWHNSNRYGRLCKARSNLNRIMKIKRKIDHEILANKIISMGDDFSIHTMYPGAKDLQKDCKGKPLDKSERKYQGNKAPSEFTMILKRKVNYHPCGYEEVDCYVGEDTI